MAVRFRRVTAFRFHGHVKSWKTPLLSFRRRPETSNSIGFWIPDQVRHDGLGVSKIIKWHINSKCGYPVRFRAGNSLELYADVEGQWNGKPVLLLHGGGQTRHSWGHTMSALGEAERGIGYAL